MEPILDENNRRFALFPIRYQNIWNLYQSQLSSFWRASEIDFSKDYQGFMTLDDNEKFYIKRILAFFASSDGIINFNISTRFLKEITILEALVCYQYQTMIENIHNESYSTMLDILVKDKNEKKELFDSVKSVDSIKKLSEWSFKWIDSDLPFSYRVIAFAVIEGVVFSGAFASIFWLKKYKGNVINGLISSNEFIARDEGQHVEFAVLLYSLLENKLDSDKVYQIVDEGVSITREFMNDALPCSIIGMNSQNMCDYIEYVADTLLVNLGYNKKYNKLNPFEFMNTIGMNLTTNFFEIRPTTYQAAFSPDNQNEELLIVEDF